MDIEWEKKYFQRKYGEVERKLKDCDLRQETIARKAAERQQRKSFVKALYVQQDTKKI
uniref:Uncharacterized protein n=1 Tax=Arion vulgaris TaxID=1028688 RepID=A0A0B7BEN4_9EUPU